MRVLPPVAVDKGWGSAWLPVVFAAAFLVLVYGVWGVGGVLRRTEQLAERTRLAREPRRNRDRPAPFDGPVDRPCR